MYDDYDEEYVSPIEDELYDYLYNDDISPHDKYIYELSDHLYKKCESLYKPEDTQPDTSDLNVEWDLFPYEEISAKFPHTYNQILVHLIEATNTKHYRYDPDNTIYGCSPYLSNNMNITPEIIHIIEKIAKHVNIIIHGVIIRGITDIIMRVAFQYGSIPLFNILTDMLGDTNQNMDVKAYIRHVLKTIPVCLLGLMCNLSFPDEFDSIVIQKARIYMATTICPNRQKIFIFPGIYTNNYVGSQFHNALKNRFCLIAEFMINECKQHGISILDSKTVYLNIYLDSTFTDACNKGETELICVYCKFDPYKYCMQSMIPGDSSDIHTLICDTDNYGVIRSPENQKWKYMCEILHALHYNLSNKNLPIDIIRDIISNYIA
jgi:hypothetical protein